MVFTYFKTTHCTWNMHVDFSLTFLKNSKQIWKRQNSLEKYKTWVVTKETQEVVQMPCDRNRLYSYPRAEGAKGKGVYSVQAWKVLCVEEEWQKFSFSAEKLIQASIILQREIVDGYPSLTLIFIQRCKCFLLFWAKKCILANEVCAGQAQSWMHVHLFALYFLNLSCLWLPNYYYRQSSC